MIMVMIRKSNNPTTYTELAYLWGQWDDCIGLSVLQLHLKHRVLQKVVMLWESTLSACLPHVRKHILASTINPTSSI